MDFKHISVLLDETIDGLNIKPDGVYVDGTLGGGGHSYEILKRLSPKGKLIGIDQDGEALKAAGERLKEFEKQVTLVRSNYCDIKKVLQELNIEKVDGILLDIGVSSYQLDNLERGFSYKSDAPLDMRMDTRQEFSAADVVNNYSEHDLFRIIRDYGEDKFAKNIAMQIAAAGAEYLDRDSVPADRVEHEKEILAAQAKNEGKPDNIIEKMIIGRINKFYKEVCLVDQEYIKDGDLSVAKYVQQTAKELGGSIKIVDYTRFEKGEGLEKKSEDFAAEVASMIK